MYLKSIEMQGFKSFASKTKLEFHDGVTAIVGPNGSGKSNVSDAVRWVLGEQSAKQLRGGNMQDVIFAGTQTRKPLGFASVAITLDNSDHALNIDFETVTVTRRLYRSGESEYMINGSQCRLKDVQELFYDTGIGKEGYSLIGQGQIDRILNGRPEEKRELFDEAAGIVKFKRRKAAALKKLEKEESNLTRVTDILSELTKQVVPLEKQSQKARIYLTKRDELKERDIAIFRMNDDRIEKELEQLSSKYENAKEQLEEADRAYNSAKEEYEKIDALISELEQKLNSIRSQITEVTEAKQQSESRIQILNEQINSSRSNKELLAVQIEGLQNDRKRKEESLDSYKKDEKDLIDSIETSKENVRKAEENLERVRKNLEEKNAESEKNKNELISLLNSRSSIKEKSQKYITLREQLEVRQADLTGRMLRLSEEKKKLRENEEKNRIAYNEICSRIAENEKSFSEYNDKLAEMKKKLSDADFRLDKVLTKYHKDQSLLESLTNIAERYEGYGHSVKKVMEQKERNSGILGVVAEIISTEEKYETALETALGGSLQNIVTDNEATAKYLIEFLKRGHFGRATFLPLTAINDKEPAQKPLNEEGVIGLASELVEFEPRFKGLVNRLLGKTYVIDTIDHAIAIGRKYKHHHRMVTLDGELMSPGGAMTGGSYKNNSNLLGRQRQLDELVAAVKKGKKDIQQMEDEIASLKKERNTFRVEQSKVNDELQQLYLNRNTAEVSLRNAMTQTDSILSDSNELEKEKSKLQQQKKEIEDFMKTVNEQMNESSNIEQQLMQSMEQSTRSIEEFTQDEHSALESVENAKMQYNTDVQKIEFVRHNIDETSSEIEKINLDIKQIESRIADESKEISDKEYIIGELQNESKNYAVKLDELNVQLKDRLEEKDKNNTAYKELFKQREELSETRGLLDKEIYRLETSIEKNESEREKNINYLFEEYELTPVNLPERSPDDDRSFSQLKQEISVLKSEIKALGNVNVNAIEEYKEVKERYEFLSVQHNDLVKAAESLKEIIEELDKNMQKKFIEEFGHIQKEFNKVFKQLFGGGMGTLELVEDMDILEAGIRIIAQPPGKKLQNMMQLSGGEKTLTAIALLFAIQNLKPSPFCLLDEIEAALDDANVDHFAKYLHKLVDNTQFIVITHRRGTMTAADRLYGITMQEKGVSTMVSVDLIESQLSN